MVIIDGKSDITKIRMEGNGRIISTGNEKRDPKIKKHKNSRSADDEPVIENLEIVPGAKAILEGGAFEKVISEKEDSEEGDVIITKDSTAVISEMVQVEGDEVRQLSLTNDETYDGNGVRIIVRNRREGVQCMQVMKVTDDGIWEQVGWFDNLWKENPISAQVDSDYYTYEYLAKDTKYTLVFNYYKYLWVDERGNTSDDLVLLNSHYIEVTPKKGRENPINKEGAVLKVDEAKGIVSWGKETPMIGYIKNAKLVYQVFSHEIKDDKERDLFIGQYEQTWDNIFDDIDFYKDFSLYNRNKIVNDTVYIISYLVDAEGNRFPIVNSDEFSFDNSLFPEISVSDKNILKFDQKPNARIIPNNADGYYIWLYNGDVGSYIAYNTTKNFNDIDLNMIIESNPNVRAAIKADDNNFSFDISWYHKEVNSITGRIDNEWIGTIAHEEDHTYVPQEGYETATATLDKTTLKIKNASEKLTKAFKENGAVKIGWDVWVDEDDHGIWLWGQGEELSTDIEANKETEFDLTKILIMNADKIQACGNKFRVTVWAKDEDNNWICQVASDIIGDFDASEYVKPVGTVSSDYVFKVTKAPNKKFIDYLTETLGATHYGLNIVVRDVKGEGNHEYMWDYKYEFSSTSATDIGKLEVDLKPCIARIADYIELKDGDFSVSFGFYKNAWEFLGLLQDDIDCHGYKLADEWKPFDITLKGDVCTIIEGGEKFNKSIPEDAVWEITVRTMLADEIQKLVDTKTNPNTWNEKCYIYKSGIYSDKECFEPFNLKTAEKGWDFDGSLNGKIYIDFTLRTKDYGSNNWAGEFCEYFRKEVEFNWKE